MMMNETVDEAIKSGFITVYANTDPEIVGQIRMYNSAASCLRARMKRINYIRYWQIGFNILMISFFSFYRSDLMFSIPVLGVLVILINAVALFRLAFFLKSQEINTLICVITTALLFFLDIKLSGLGIVNFIIFLISFFMRKPLKVHKGYPDFNAVYIYEARYNAPG